MVATKRVKYAHVSVSL